MLEKSTWILLHIITALLGSNLHKSDLLSSLAEMRVDKPDHASLTANKLLRSVQLNNYSFCHETSHTTSTQSFAMKSKTGKGGKSTKNKMKTSKAQICLPCASFECRLVISAFLWSKQKIIAFVKRKHLVAKHEIVWQA